MSINTGVANQFRAVGEGFEVEYAGPVIRIWHVPCLNHELLADDDRATVVERKAVHRCGERVSPWDRGEHGVWS
jgi:hypothetical protein